jgi:hypothetical protein
MTAVSSDGVVQTGERDDGARAMRCCEMQYSLEPHHQLTL